MKLAWFAAAALLVAGAPAFAREAPPPTPGASVQAPVDPERLALARQMMAIFDVKAAMHGMYASLARSMRTPETATADQKARVQQFLASMGAGMEAVTPDMMDEVAQLYARTFTAQEMRDSLAFYQSPSGRAMVAKLPAVMREVVPMEIGLMPKIVATAKADYCSHRTCDQTDETMFSAMSRAYGQPKR